MNSLKLTPVPLLRCADHGQILENPVRQGSHHAVSLRLGLGSRGKAETGEEVAGDPEQTVGRWPGSLATTAL